MGLRWSDLDSTIKDLTSGHALTEAPKWMLYLTRS